MVASGRNSARLARRITTQETFEYDRRTGLEVVTGNEVVSVIVSVAPLPVDNVMLWLDRKYRMIRDVESAKPADFERKTLVFIADHYAQNSL